MVCSEGWTYWESDKGRFHEATNLLKKHQRPNTFGRWDGPTSSHRQVKLSFGAKTTVQCSNQFKHKIAVKLVDDTHL